MVMALAGTIKRRRLLAAFPHDDALVN